MGEHASLAPAPVLGASHEGIHGLGRHHAGRHALGDRHVDVLAITGIALEEQGHRGGGGGVETTFVLRLKAAVLQGLPALDAADAHDHAHGIADDLLALVLAIGTVLAKGSNGRHHQARIELLQIVITQPKGGQIAGLVAFHHHVNVFNQFLEDRSAGNTLQIDGGALLVEV